MTGAGTAISRREALAFTAKVGLGALILRRTSVAQTRTVPVTGMSVPELTSIDELLVEYLRNNSLLAGASLAVARNGHIVYARAFGYADIEARQAAEPSSLFRIASVSKTFTSAAIMLLVQQGKLKLSDHVFPLLALECHFTREPLSTRD